MPRLKTPRLVTGTRIAVASEQTVIKLRWISRSIRRAPTLIYPSYGKYFTLFLSGKL